MPAKRKPDRASDAPFSVHVRLAPSEYQRVIEMAERERRSVSAQVSVIVSGAIAAIEKVRS